MRYANCNAVAPQPLDRFNPVRSGEIKICNLRLIDTFGQIKDLNYPAEVIVPKTLKSEQAERVYLPPSYSSTSTD
ncbi:MAG: hypothetical protein HC930_12105 [Hydrococcus sp. SU_1_0]|nr:hypothetical protein [Hydrococcus sp. SU_1_0]